MSVFLCDVLRDFLSTLWYDDVGSSSQSGCASDGVSTLALAHGLLTDLQVPSHILLLAHFFSGSCFKSAHVGCLKVVSCYAHQSNFLSALLNPFLQRDAFLNVDEDCKALCTLLGYTGSFASGLEMVDYFKAYIHGCLFDFDVLWLAQNVSTLRKDDVVRLLVIHNIPTYRSMSVLDMKLELLKHFFSCTCAPDFVFRSSPCGFSCSTTSNTFTRKDALLQAISTHNNFSAKILAPVLAYLCVQVPLGASPTMLCLLLKNYVMGNDAGGSYVFASEIWNCANQNSDPNPSETYAASRTVEHDAGTRFSSFVSSFQASLEPVPHDAEVLDDLNRSGLWPRPLTSIDKDMITS